MAMRKWKFDIKPWVEYMDVWCDPRILEQIEDIEGVIQISRWLPGKCSVYYDHRYNIEDIMAKIRALAEEKGD